MPQVDLIDECFIVAAPADIAAVLHDGTFAAQLWPGLELAVAQDRGLLGIHWTCAGPLVGSAEVWLEAHGDGVIVHCYLRVDPATAWSDRRSRREVRKRQRQVKRLMFAGKDALEGARPRGVGAPGPAGSSRGGVKLCRRPADIGEMTPTRCPTCHAAVRPQSLWCQLCHLDLRPPQQPPAVAVEPSTAGPPTAGPPAPEPVSIDGGGATRGRHARPEGWPCVACGSENDLESASCTTCGSGFLAPLHVDPRRARPLPVIGDLSRLGRPAIFGLAVGVGVLGALVLSVVMGLASAVL